MVAVQLPLVTTGSTTAAGGTGDIRTIRDGWEKRAWVRRSRPLFFLVELNGIEPSAS